jgi:hypothetical protein
MNFCLPKETAEVFKKHLNGELNPQKLEKMTSEERRAAFKKYLGEEHSHGMNILFEKKLLLKDKEKGMINFIKQAAGLNAEEKAAVSKKISEEFARKQERLLNPKEGESFLSDLVGDIYGKRFKTELTTTETKNIAELATKAEQARVAFEASPKGAKDIAAYGEAKLKYLDYVDSISPKGKGNFFVNLLGLTRTIPVVGDMGWGGRQGWGMSSRPEFYKSIAKSFQYLVDHNSYEKLRASVIGDPDFELLKKAKLRMPALADTISGKEDEFMSNWPSKVPGLKQTERSQQGQATYLRFSVAKQMLNSARLRGQEVTQKMADDIAKSVNNATGSGNIGINDRGASWAPLLNSTLFSARKLSGDLNMLNPWNLIDPKIALATRVQNLRNLVGTVGATAASLYLAKLSGAEVQLDPKSTDFGKAVWGKYHVDFTGGRAPLVTLIARLMDNSTTNSSGVNKKLGQGYKPDTRGTLILNFARNKLAPFAGIIADALFGPIATHDPAIAKALFGPPKKGTPFDAKREAASFAPFLLDLIVQGLQDDPDGLLFGAINDYFGRSVQIY